MMAARDIAVVIPVKDRIEPLCRAIESVLAQSALPNEIIVVDDGSHIPITSAMLPIDNAGTRITIIRQGVNTGAGLARNKGVYSAKTDIIAFLDSDDAFSPDYLASVLRHWNSGSRSAEMVASGFYWCGDDLTPYRTQIAPPLVSHRDLVTKGNLIGGCSVISVRRGAFLEIGGFDSSRGSEDWSLFLKFSKRQPISVLQKALVYYRAPSQSSLDTMTTAPKRQLNALFLLRRSMLPADRLLANAIFRLIACGHLLSLGRRKTAVRLLLGSMRFKPIPLKLAVYMLARISIGNRGWSMITAATYRWRKTATARKRRRQSPISSTPVQKV